MIPLLYGSSQIRYCGQGAGQCWKKAMEEEPEQNMDCSRIYTSYEQQMQHEVSEETSLKEAHD